MHPPACARSAAPTPAPPPKGPSLVTHDAPPPPACSAPDHCLPEAEVKQYAAEVLLALQYLHLQGFIYRWVPCLEAVAGSELLRVV